MEFRYDTFCGLYCGACDVLQANKTGTVETLAQAWGMEPDQLRCHGCKSQVNAVYCIDCDIKECAEKRSVAYCFQCDDYPCARLVDFRNDDHAHHSVVLQNLGHMCRLGLERWLDEQRARWSCPNCGVEFTWYDKACRACGGKVSNCEEEEGRIVDECTGNRQP
jgi:predicted RNA-binding Zn-ribbon protein involved in translation (DUF1610 family)